MMFQEKLKKDFYDFFFNEYFILKRGLRKAIVEFSHLIGGDILDFGCGEKPHQSLFRNYNSYVGVDIENWGNLSSRSKVDIFFDGKILPFEDQAFDSVLAFEVFEHVLDVEASLKEIFRVLKPGGQILFSTPFTYGEHGQPFDYWRFTEFGLSVLLEKNGFLLISCHKSTNIFQTTLQMMILSMQPNWLNKLGLIGKLIRFAIRTPINVASIAFSSKKCSSDFYLNIVCIAKKV